VSFKQTIVTILGLLVIFVAIVVATHLSMWFIWELIPSEQQRYAINNALLPENKIFEAAPHHPIQSIQPLIKNTRRFALSVGKDNFVFVSLPRNPFILQQQKALRQALDNQGLNTQRLGLLLISAHNEQLPTISFKSIFQALSHAWLDQFKYRFTPHPLLIGYIQPSSTPLIDDPLFFISKINHQARENKTTITTYVAENYNGLKGISKIKPPTPDRGEDTLRLFINGQILGNLPHSLKNTWTSAIYRQFNFTNTSPDIINKLTSYNQVELVLSPDSLTISTKHPDNDFSEYFKGIVQAEEAYSRPDQQAFKLPDGTLGYEKVPGPARSVFSITDIQEAACQHASWPASPATDRSTPPSNEPGYQHIWICTNEDLVTISNNESTAVKTVKEFTSSKGNWAIDISPTQLREILLPFSQLINLPLDQTHLNIIGQESNSAITVTY